MVSKIKNICVIILDFILTTIIDFIAIAMACTVMAVIYIKITYVMPAIAVIATGYKLHSAYACPLRGARRLKAASVALKTCEGLWIDEQQGCVPLRSVHRRAVAVRWSCSRVMQRWSRVKSVRLLRGSCWGRFRCRMS